MSYKFYARLTKGKDEVFDDRKRKFWDWEIVHISPLRRKITTVITGVEIILEGIPEREDMDYTFGRV